MIDALPMTAVFAVVAVAGLAVIAGGIRMTGLADVVADRSGLGEAITGGVLLGMATSLAGTVVSVTAGIEGRASLAYANGIGGIAAQTAFLAIADLTYRKANLEHASADARGDGARPAPGLGDPRRHLRRRGGDHAPHPRDAHVAAGADPRHPP